MANFRLPRVKKTEDTDTEVEERCAMFISFCHLPLLTKGKRDTDMTDSEAQKRCTMFSLPSSFLDQGTENIDTGVKPIWLT